MNHAEMITKKKAEMRSKTSHETAMNFNRKHQLFAFAQEVLPFLQLLDKDPDFRFTTDAEFEEGEPTSSLLASSMGFKSGSFGRITEGIEKKLHAELVMYGISSEVSDIRLIFTISEDLANNEKTPVVAFIRTFMAPNKDQHKKEYTDMEELCADLVEFLLFHTVAKY